MGNPSKVVATAEGVPGIPMRHAETSPPDSPPTYTPIMVARPCRGGIPKVKGRVRMMVMVMVIPGMAPPTSPARTPAAKRQEHLGFEEGEKGVQYRVHGSPQKNNPRGRKTNRYFSNTR